MELVRRRNEWRNMTSTELLRAAVRRYGTPRERRTEWAATPYSRIM